MFSGENNGIFFPSSPSLCLYLSADLSSPNLNGAWIPASDKPTVHCQHLCSPLFHNNLPML